ncbi:hypothetical protein [Actinacidiphila rubida]|uniref:hypothetical protein n=1 Tax=Actinacidiphila rubida TaxID=310780 RepID=UPI001FEA7FF1|nr:hypothetical protein [Actinacidiphila rubida]
MTEQPYTLSAILVRLDAREQQIEAQAMALRTQIEQLTSHLGELERQLEHVQITRKTLADLPEPDLPSAPPVTQDPPEHPAYEQILAALAATDRAMRAREVTVAIELPATATNVNNVRHKLKRLTSRKPHRRGRAGPVRPHPGVGAPQPRKISSRRRPSESGMWPCSAVSHGARAALVPRRYRVRRLAHVKAPCGPAVERRAARCSGRGCLSSPTPGATMGGG